SKSRSDRSAPSSLIHCAGWSAKRFGRVEPITIAILGLVIYGSYGEECGLDLVYAVRATGCQGANSLTLRHRRRLHFSVYSAGTAFGLPSLSSATMTKPAWVTRSIRSDR